MSEQNGDWYCRNCGYICNSRVTNSETCDACHIPVEWHTEDVQGRIADLEQQVEAHKAKISDQSRIEVMHHQTVAGLRQQVEALKAENNRIKAANELLQGSLNSLTHRVDPHLFIGQPPTGQEG